MTVTKRICYPRSIQYINERYVEPTQWKTEFPETRKPENIETEKDQSHRLPHTAHRTQRLICYNFKRPVSSCSPALLRAACCVLRAAVL